MPQSANEAIFRKFMDAVERYDYEVVAALCADDLEWTCPGEPPGGGTFRGKAAFLEALKSWDEPQKAAFPSGLAITVANVVEAGGRLAAEWVSTGQAADGREASIRGSTFVEIADGKILSGRDYWDMAELMPYFE